MKELIRMVVVLSTITGLAGLVLSGLKVWTTPIIEEQVLTYVQGPAIKKIFEDATNNPIADRKVMAKPGAPGETLFIFPAIKDGKLTAVAVEAAGKGYGGMVGVMVGFDVTQDKVAGISVTTHKETPGLGSRIEDTSFTKQFRNRALDKVGLKKDGGDIDAISGATFSSIGASDAVKQAAQWYMALKDDIKKSW
ncbi:RnfABCDGE type electron transport complex subunit G [Megalodesulfovibrio gigas]|uniref:Ion-translocating oxidoreductase complex subunit G n=1 Tax=Megalodesulfovibrio gigas (strain ATCC 19364 / DSM 1382 / NCIMB 9332 / VKM B-1759) TaxID=1121448 RepID=T2GAS0_MEGG1|nr:RnfABCDGE type electron transport complex subunit G [Megalodesulfovibrio gigas]AGW13274.1 putative RnfABCDGE type electron transport complex subunit G [Megalodesulfovibrio gigas DSM 1382 = ATCC 19364]